MIAIAEVDRAIVTETDHQKKPPLFLPKLKKSLIKLLMKHRKSKKKVLKRKTKYFQTLLQMSKLKMRTAKRMTKIAEVDPDHGGDPEVQAEEANKDVNTEKETTRQMILVVRNPVQDRGIADEIPETEIAIVLEIAIIAHEIVIANVNVNAKGNDVNEKGNVVNVKDVIVNVENVNVVNVNKNVVNGKDGSKNDETVNEKNVNKKDEIVNVKKSNFADVRPPKRLDVVNRLNNVGKARNVTIQALMTMLMIKLKNREIRTERTGTRVSQKIVLTMIEAGNQGKNKY